MVAEDIPRSWVEAAAKAHADWEVLDCRDDAREEAAVMLAAAKAQWKREGYVLVKHDEATVERMSREVFWVDDQGGHIKGRWTWDTIPEEGRENYRRLIRVALTAAQRGEDGQPSGEQTA